MPIGIIINSLGLAVGSILGGIIGSKLSAKIGATLTMIIGVTSMALGIIAIQEIKTMPAVFLAVILGSLIGEILNIEMQIEKLVSCFQHFIKKTPFNKPDKLSDEEFISQFVGIAILFCASGTGIFGALKSGFTGDHSILFAKAILDFFTAMIFSTSLGYFIAFLSIPQFIILSCLFISATFIMPITTPVLIADFTACGGIIMLSTGLRISKIKSIPIANMLPALVLVMSISHIWNKLF